jgi:hypothetical protein
MDDLDFVDFSSVDVIPALNSPLVFEGDVITDEELTLVDILEEEQQSTVSNEEEDHRKRGSPRSDDSNRRTCDAPLPEIPRILFKERKVLCRANTADRRLTPTIPHQSADLIAVPYGARPRAQESIRDSFSSVVHVCYAVQEYQLLFGDQFPMTLPRNFNEILWEANPSPRDAVLALDISIAGALAAREMRQFSLADELYSKARDYAAMFFDEAVPGAAGPLFWLSLYAFTLGDMPRAGYYSTLARRMAEDTGDFGLWAYYDATLLEGHLSLDEQFRSHRLQQAGATPNQTTRMKVHVPLNEAFHLILSLRSTAGAVPAEKLWKIRQLCRLAHRILENACVTPCQDPMLYFGSLVLLLGDLFMAWLDGEYAKAQKVWMEFLQQANRTDLGGHNIFIPFVLALLVHLSHLMNIPLDRESLPFRLQQALERYPLAQIVLASQDHQHSPPPAGVCQPELRPQLEGISMPVPVPRPKPDLTIRLRPRAVVAPACELRTTAWGAPCGREFGHPVFV